MYSASKVTFWNPNLPWLNIVQYSGSPGCLAVYIFALPISKTEDLAISDLVLNRMTGVKSEGGPPPHTQINLMYQVLSSDLFKLIYNYCTIKITRLTF